MIVVFASNDLDGNTGVMGNKPEQRKRLVLQTLKEAGFSSREVLRSDEDLSLARQVHDGQMVDFFENAWRDWEELWQQQQGNRSYLVPYGVNNTDSDDAPPLVPCYVAPHVDGVQRLPRTVIGKLAFFALDRETPLTSHTLPSLRFDMSVLREAVDVALTRRHVAYALCTHPGHHAGKAYYGGFCFLNNAAIVVRMLQSKLTTTAGRVAVLDVDYHAGNGTMSVFYNDPSIFTCSLHADPDIDYPFNCGFADQTGGPDAPNSCWNVCFPKGTQWKHYEPHLRDAIHRIAAFRPDALVISLGLDTLLGDPVAYPTAALELKVDDFKEMGKIVFEDSRLAHIPTVVVQEGGYKLDDVPHAVKNFFMATMKN